MTAQEMAVPRGGPAPAERSRPPPDVDTSPLPLPVRWIARPRTVLLGLLAVAAGIWLLEGPSLVLGAVAWGAGLVLVSWGFGGPAAADARREARLTLGERWALVAVVGVGLGLRVWAPESHPNGIHPDEAATGLVSAELLRGGGPHPFGFAFIGDPAPFMYAQALMMWLFGVSVGSDRLLAGVVGAAGLISLWLLARPLFGARVALLATALLAVTASHLHFSRMALNVIEVPTFGLLGIALAWRGLREGRPIWHVLAGMTLAFAQFAAFGARAFVLGVAGTYLAALVARRSAWRSVIGGGVLALAAMLVALGPQLAHVRDDPSELYDRLRFRSVFRRWDQATEIHGTDDPAGVMLGQVTTNLLAFATATDRGPFYQFAQEPLLVGPLAAASGVGLLIALVRAREPRFATLLLTTASVLLGGVLSAGVPQFHRIVPLVPIACLLAAIALDRLDHRLVGPLLGRVSSGGRIARGVYPVVGGALVLLVAAHGVQAIFVRHPAQYPWQPQTAWARWAGEQSRERLVLLAGAPDVFAWDERVRLLADGGTVRDIVNPTVDLSAALAEGRPFVLAVNPGLDEWLPLLRYQLPGASFEPQRGPRGEPLLLAATIEAPEPRPADGAGLRGEVTVEERGRKSTTPRTDPALAFRESSRLVDGGRPYRARWWGSLLAEATGTYRLDVFTEGSAELLIDGKTVVEGRAASNARSLRADVNLAAGPHSLELRYSYIRGLGTLELRWQPPGGARTLIPPSALRPD